MDDKKDKDVLPTETRDPKNLFIFELFEKDNYFLFIYKKTEKIVSALYLVSNLFPDEEPIRWQLRKCGVSIISEILSVISGPSPLSRMEIVSKVAPQLLRIISLIDISSTAGLISEMNYLILKRELEDLLSTLNYKEKGGGDFVNKLVTLDKDFFAVPRTNLGPSSSESVDKNSSVKIDGHARENVTDNGVHSWSDIRQGMSNFKGQSVGGETGLLKNSTYHGSQIGASRTPQFKGQGTSTHVSGGAREFEILRLVGLKNNLTIRDFSLVIKGCSEKTIQRELSRLVKVGVLNKIGERRWSRYSLASEQLAS
ncbi:MAG: hypothetical protein EXS46_01340 [Candidatus Taylorbacteria bacterium]|nr:hypothetical protein [Candidatus Taylorbacteria bacterium]